MAPIDLAGGPAGQRRMRARFPVDAEPGSDDALGVARVCQLVQVHRLVLQRTPQPLDEDVVEMAIRLTKAFRSSPETRLGLQITYDLWQARSRIDDIKVERFEAA